MKFIISLTLFCVAGIDSFGQIYISTYYGVGNYKMSKLKEFNQQFLYTNPNLGLKIVNDFPVRPYYGIEFSDRVKKVELGGEIFYNTTGSKINYTDYSGDLSMIQRVGSTSFGGFMRCYLLKSNNFFWKFRLGLSASVSDLELTQSIRIFKESQTESYEFKSSEFRGNTGTEFSYVLRRVCFSAFFTLEQTLFASGFKWTENQEAKFLNNRGEELKPNWSGYLVGLKLGINIQTSSSL
jgi:hypothetical protein